MTTAIGKLAEALSKAQAEIKGALKDSTNPHFKNDYADLESVWEACRIPLTKNGLSVTQVNGRDEHGIYLRTILLHSSGESVSGDTPILLGARQDMQALGSAITYARRYGLSAIVGIAPRDDDGELASGREEIKKPALVKTEEQKKSSSFRKKEIANVQTNQEDGDL